MANTKEPSKPLLSDQKKIRAAELLKDSLGILLYGRDFIAVALKAESLTTIMDQPDPDRVLQVLGICNSNRDSIELEKDFGRLCSTLKNRFSPRDMTFEMIIDFLSGYLDSNIFDKSTEKALAMEFFVIEGAAETGVNVAAINLEGELKEPEPGERFVILGAPSPARRKQILPVLQRISSESVQDKEGQISKDLCDKIEKELEEMLNDGKGKSFIIVLPLLLGMEHVCEHDHEPA